MAKTYKNLYSKIYDFDNLFLAWRKARKGKTKMPYVIEFKKNLEKNLLDIQFELKSQFYKPMPLETFPLRDPKTRIISKSDFRDRIVHHAICSIIEPIFEKVFINDSCANRKNKGVLFAIKRFNKFKYKISHNGKLAGWFTNNQVKGHYLKADIKHYFGEVDHEILLSLITRKIKCIKTVWLIKEIIKPNFSTQRESYLQRYAPWQLNFTVLR